MLDWSYDMPKISIVIPVYNVELYLRKCIESILAQTYIDFECILVDDGSLDNCPMICDEYATRDHRVIVIHQKNSGVSAARNAGLNRAKGEWIGFVDSDDWCDPGMFEYLLKNAEEYQADISICGYRTIEEGNKIVHSSQLHPHLIMNSKNAVKRLILNKCINAPNWNKLVKRQLFLCNDEILRYDETIRYGEDKLLMFYLFKRADKIVYFPQAYYNYFRRSDSISMIYKKKGTIAKFIPKFDATIEMLKTESDKTVRRWILARKGIVAANSCLRYIHYNGFSYDDNYFYLKDIVRQNIFFISIFGTMKEKIGSYLVFFPFIFYLFCIFRREKI